VIVGTATLERRSSNFTWRTIFFLCPTSSCLWEHELYNFVCLF